MTQILQLLAINVSCIVDINTVPTSWIPHIKGRNYEEVKERFRHGAKLDRSSQLPLSLIYLLERISNLEGNIVSSMVDLSAYTPEAIPFGEKLAHVLGCVSIDCPPWITRANMEEVSPENVTAAYGSCFGERPLVDDTWRGPILDAIDTDSKLSSAHFS